MVHAERRDPLEEPPGILDEAEQQVESVQPIPALAGKRERQGVSEEVSFGALLRAYRQAADLTIEELSHASGVSVRAIGDMERGVSRGPQRRTVAALAEVLRLPSEDHDALIASARAGRPRHGPSTAGICELPRGTGDFTGRGRELELLRRLAEQAGTGEGAVVATISGTAGIGKTALAVHAARHLTGLFPDGRFYVDLRGMDSVPPTPGAVLSRLLKALGVAEQRIPNDEEERAGLYRALLGDRRCLVVLDNAADETQIRPLLPAAGPGMTIITSRRSLAGLEGVRQIPLEQLSGQEAAGLLRAIVGEERTEIDPDSVAELARLCGHLPLAVRIAGNRLQSRPGWTISQLAGRLENEERRLEALAVGDLAVAAAFTLSYQQLSGTARFGFRRLALAAAPDFGIPLAAVLTQVDLFEAEDALEELVELGLLTSPYAGRYVFHDLVRLYARAQLEQEEPIEDQQQARRRMENWLLEVALVAGRWFQPAYGAPPPEWRSLVTLDNRQEAGDWLRAEDTAWLEALRSAARRGEHATVVEVAGSMYWFSDMWIQWGHWREVFELSSGAAHAMDDRLREAVHLNLLSWALSACEGRMKEGEATALRALELAREVGDIREQARALNYAGSAILNDSASLERASLERALEYTRRAADLLLQAGDLDSYPQAMESFITVLRRAGRVEEALEHSLALVATLRDPAYGGSPAIVSHVLGGALDQLGAAYLALERWEEAADAYQQALPELRARPIALDLGRTQHGLGTALRRLGRVEEARQALAEALRLLEESNETEEAAEVVKELKEIAGPGAAAGH
ncbi:Predicted ATPase [Streptosporangium subroseum]|uniref:Predicted ATPase n=1 Tax=Streptosporangium subroseum TaxID=106412 RepID=A0A239NL65_9ACTN|nr:helix-turn-helix domain-containing protein [Streptosporangium subroseum]SNT55657.1 Predicted ATPase [Streptosporangium subroseum]